MNLSQYTVLSFDCYGTLIDWDAGLSQQLQRIAPEMDADDLLQRYSVIEAEIEHASPTMLYRDVVAASAARVAESLDREIPATLAAEIGGSVGAWPPFPDSVAALAALREHCALVVLSNVDRQSFAGSSAQLGEPFDHLLSAEDLGSYKPSLRNFEALLAYVDSLGVDRSQHLHVAQSLFHDHVPAKAMGIDSVWINRRHGKSGEGASGPASQVVPDAEYPDMASFTAALVAAKTT